MPITVVIDDLPADLATADAVEIAYGADLDWIEARLRNRLSMLVECDKQLSFYLFRELRTRLKREVAGEKYSFNVVDGQPQQQRTTDGDATDGAASALPARSQGLLQTTLANLQQRVFEFDVGKILVVPHLDLLTTTTRSGLSMEARECAALLYENPELVVLGFRDPSFEIPKVIEAAFPCHRTVMGVPREKLPQLVTRREARKFAAEAFNPYELFKYTSGLNVVRFRQVMGHFHRHRDVDPRADDVRDRYRELRELTIAADFSLPDIRFDRDIAGYRSVKRQLREDVLDLVATKDGLTDPREVDAIEALIPRGIIFQGPPGTGKTLFAKAMATELSATVIVVSGPEIKSKWLGETEANVRRIFAQARRSAPSMIIFEEIDSIAPSRAGDFVHEVTHSTVNQILTEMDGFRSEELVFVVGTTNFAASLDPALLRPGRFELRLRIDNPHDFDRKDILRLYRDKLSLDFPDDVIEHAVNRTRGFADPVVGHRYTGDHLYALAKALKRVVLREGKGKPVTITTAHVDRVLEANRKRRVPSTDELTASATHEAGHAVLQEVLPHHAPLDKVTISGEDEALGPYYTLAETPANEWEFYTEGELRDMICACYGGRVAEDLLLGHVTIGAAMDLYQATRLAQVMVGVEGMGPLGAAGEHAGDHLRAFASPMPGQRDWLATPSEVARQRFDDAVDTILRQEFERAQTLLREHRDLVAAIRDRLLDKKELARADVADLLPETSHEKARRYEQRKSEIETQRRMQDPGGEPDQESSEAATEPADDTTSTDAHSDADADG